MFTGIIEAVGTVANTEYRQGDLRLRVYCEALDWSDVAIGDSIATNGVCLTVVEFAKQSFTADVSVETLKLTTAARWKIGDRVNLEKALMPQSRLGGHIVSGHVDGIAEVLSRSSDARSERFTVQAPSDLARYIAHKGSITVDGISLTVNSVDGDTFALNIVPHTLKNTVIETYQAGSKVNIEVDVIARYLERLLRQDDDNLVTGPTKSSTGAKITESFLMENGYEKPSSS